ncbi:hypothetical protein A9Q99_20020 [Gammaproteobacteria bacterium 45_16_T64]|nr:hypothetical protein A9Q99_20020 [Gammaproteobacteria bacterium 45_16_T64]
MDTERRIKLLQGIPVFGGIKAEVIRVLLEQSSSTQLKAGSFVFREGDHSSSMYIIEEGSIAIIKCDDDHQYLLRRMQEGDCIGEMALFDFMPRSASAYVTEDALMITLTSADLMDIYKLDMEQFALLQMNMGREVTRRLRVADERCFRHRVEAEITDGSIEFFEIDGEPKVVYNE